MTCEHAVEPETNYICPDCQRRIDNNKLIAEFLGWEQIGLTCTFYEPKDSFIDSLPDTDLTLWVLPHDPLHPEELHFHKSWDWLMPVVEKIVDMDHKTSELAYYMSKIRCNLSWLNIERTHKYCALFIKCYNKGKSCETRKWPTPEESPYLYRRKEITL